MIRVEKNSGCKPTGINNYVVDLVTRTVLWLASKTF